jgi:myo-inositol-1(or 4)-monophosphatase
LPANDPSLLQRLETVIREAGDIARVTSQRKFERWTKGADRSPVCEADIAVNDFLHTRLRELLPDAGWLSEETEDDPAARTKERVWVVDPIDGTRAFINGRTDWTISVGLLAAGEPVLAALYAPVTEQMFLAERGAGALLNREPIRVRDSGTLQGAKAAGPKRMLERLETIDSTVLPQPKVHSLALRLTRVGSAELDVAFASGGSHDWDLAAAALLVHEAGGVLTDLAGRPPSFNRPQLKHGALVAAGPARHEALLTLLRDRMPEFA